MSAKKKQEQASEPAKALAARPTISPSRSRIIVGPHYEFTLKFNNDYHEEKKGDAWIVYLERVHLFVVGDPDEPLEALHPVFAEACCALWCATLERYYRRHLEYENKPPESNWLEKDIAASIWHGDQMRAAFRLTECFWEVREHKRAEQLAKHAKTFRSGHFTHFELAYLREAMGADLLDGTNGIFDKP